MFVEESELFEFLGQDLDIMVLLVELLVPWLAVEKLVQGHPVLVLDQLLDLKVLAGVCIGFSRQSPSGVESIL